MSDRLTREQRSRNMARIRATHTQPELLVRSALHRAGLRFRLHQKSLPGRPDIVLKRYRAVIFVHGCFWHRHSRCRYAVLPKTRAAFWRTKLVGNRKRDERQLRDLEAAAWRVLVIWECALRNPADRSAVAARAVGWVRGTGAYAEIPAARARARRRRPHSRS